MKRILTYCPNHIDGISFYRMHGPLGELEKQGLIKVQNHSNTLEGLVDWTYFTKNDIAFIQRPSLRIDKKFVEICKDYGLKIWSDFDDDLLHLPDDNDVFHRFSSDEAREAIRYTLENSDVVTTASRYLADIYEKEFKLRGNIIVLPNAIPPYYLRFKKSFKYSKKVCWRGTPSHVPELLYHEPDIIDLIEKHDKEWLFLGVNPYFIFRKLTKNRDRIKWSKGLLSMDFIKVITEFNASVHFVPLLDSHFHRAKSNLAWLDATLAGSVTLAPNFEEWKKPGLWTYKAMSNGDFWTQLNRLLNEPAENLEKAHNLSWEYIKDNLMLDKINVERLKIINGL